jgi:tetratricopeptide (TPR) repeat protein
MFIFFPFSRVQGEYVKCPECGFENEEGSTYCSNCGEMLVKKMEKKGKGKVKIIAGILVVVIAAGLGYVMFFGDETERANELVELANGEIERGNEHLNTVDVKLAEFREVNLDVGDEGEINNEVQVVSGFRQDAQQLKTTVGRVKDHFQKAKEYYEEADGLKLPGWYHEYIGLKVEALEKDLERMGRIEGLLDNYVLYYGFAESYLRAEVMLVDVLDALDEGNSRMGDGDYSGAVDSYKDALSQLRDSQEEFGNAGELIDLEYMEDLDVYLSGIDLALDALVDAAEFLNLGGFSQANTLLEDATEVLGSLGESPAPLVKEGLELWYEENIEKIISETEVLLREVKQLEEEARDLYEENT